MLVVGKAANGRHGSLCCVVLPTTVQASHTFLLVLACHLAGNGCWQCCLLWLSEQCLLPVCVMAAAAQEECGQSVVVVGPPC